MLVAMPPLLVFVLSRSRGVFGLQTQQQLCCKHEIVAIPTSKSGPPRQEVSVEDVTGVVQKFVEESGLQEGYVTIMSKHTTTGITINEYETRLAGDLREWLLGLAPPDGKYGHNDIDERPDGEAERQRCLENGWNVDDPEILQKWRDQEPINAHSHLLAMLLGATENVPVSRGQLLLGQWQSIMLVDLDGPRDRNLLLSTLGFK